MLETNHPAAGYAPGCDIAASYGDPNESSVGITKITFDRLLKLEQPDACIALYAFYCYTGRWQKTEQAHCTEAFAAQALGWSERTVRRVKARLVAADLVNVVKHVDRSTGQVKGWYIRVRHMVRLVVHPDRDGQVENPPGQKPTRPLVSPKCLKTGNRNASELVGALPLNAEKGRKKFVPPSLKEIEIQCAAIGLKAVEGKKFFDYQEAKGWRVGNSPMVKWQAALNTWKTHHEERNGNGRTPPAEPEQVPEGWDAWMATRPQYQELHNSSTYKTTSSWIKKEFHDERKGQLNGQHHA